MKLSEITTPVGLVQLMGLEVLSWRFDCLVEAGYPVEVAVSLAERADIDLHEAVGLLARGAKVDEAVRILT